jgi:sugar phosphate isomerase/epimerase
MNNLLIMHINYLEQGQSIEYICKKAVEIGFDGVEFRRAMDDMSDAEYTAEIARYAGEYGLKHVLFGGPGVDLMRGDAATRGEIDGYKRFLDAASAKIKLTTINFMTGWLSKQGVSGYENMGSALADDALFEWTAKGCAEIADYAPSVKFAFETHMGYIHDLPAPTMKLVKLIDRANFGVNLDYGNMTYFPKYDTFGGAIDTCGDKLFYTHLKNQVKIGGAMVPTSLADGEVNHRQFLKKLRDVGYNAPLCIEAPRNGDREWFAWEDFAYIKSLVNAKNI